MLATAAHSGGGLADTQADLNGDGTREVIVATRDAKLQVRGTQAMVCVYGRCTGRSSPAVRGSPSAGAFAGYTPQAT